MLIALNHASTPKNCENPEKNNEKAVKTTNFKVYWFGFCAGRS